MKKLLSILLTLLMVFTLVGCNSKEDTPIVQEPEKQEEVAEPTKEEPELVGGYVDAEDGTLTNELKDIFAKALDGLMGATYEPQELVATQVVAGTNYKFLASGTKTTNPITKGTYYITIYKDLQGNVELKDIEVIEERQEEVKQEISKEEDSTQYSYWVVFYNPDGNELQRSAIKYGTVPSYDSGTPQYWDENYWYKFICWTDNQGNEIKEFKPIIGNTYIYAKYEIGGKLKKEASTPTPSHVCSKTSTYLLYIDDVPSQFSATVYVYEWDSGNNCYTYLETKTGMDTLKFNPMITVSDIGKYYHTNNKEIPHSGNQQICDDYEAHEITCFVAGTQVQYDLLGHTKNIEDFKVGDQIVSYDINTNKYYLAKVENVFVHDGIGKARTLANVILEDGSIISMTPNHPILTTAGFKAIDNNQRPKLKEGQFVMTTNGWTMINKINIYNCEPTTTYNLGIIDYDEIKDDDTYDTYVAGGVIVHNVY